VSEGLWYARGEAFTQQPFMQTLRWVRTFGDVVFIVGALAMAWQVVSGLFGSRLPQAAGAPLARASR
jgi:nitric oxide reductase subunit B